jgi:hypothetical protein
MLRKSRKFISALLAAILVLTAVPFTAAATTDNGLITVFDEYGTPHQIMDGEIMVVIRDARGNIVDNNSGSGMGGIMPMTTFINGNYTIPAGGTLTTMRYELQANSSQRVRFTHRMVGYVGTPTGARSFAAELLVSTSLGHNPVVDRVVHNLTYVAPESIGATTLTGRPSSSGATLHFSRYINNANRPITIHLTISRS